MRSLIVVSLVLTVAGCGAPSTDYWLEQLKDPDVVKRRQAIRELAARTAEPERAVPALTEALQDESGYVRHDAAWAIGTFGAEAREAVPALTVARNDQARNVRVAAVAALRRIDPLAARKPDIR
jgi:HEAT repeat protein